MGVGRLPRVGNWAFLGPDFCIPRRLGQLNHRTAIGGPSYCERSGIFTDGAADVDSRVRLLPGRAMRRLTQYDTTKRSGIMILPPLVGGCHRASSSFLRC